VDRRANPVPGFALVQALTGAAALGLVPLVGKLPAFVAGLVLSHQREFSHLAALEFLMISGLLFVPTFLMGAAFPLALKTVSLTDVLPALVPPLRIAERGSG